MTSFSAVSLFVSKVVLRYQWFLSSLVTWGVLRALRAPVDSWILLLPGVPHNDVLEAWNDTVHVCVCARWHLPMLSHQN